MAPRRLTSATTRTRTSSNDLIYPGYPLKVGVRDTSSIRAVQRRLMEVGCGPIPITGIFDSPTRLAVQRLQARSVSDEQAASYRTLAKASLAMTHDLSDQP